MSEPNEPLLSVRAAVVLLLAVLVGIGAGGLTVLSGQPVAAGVLAGLFAAGATLLGAPRLIRDQN